MSTFRAEFYNTLQTMATVTADPLLTDLFPPTDPHNVGARILRTGLAVSAFALLERYIRSVFDALVLDLASAQIVYGSFPESLKKFLVVDSVAGLGNAAYFIKDAVTKLSFLESEVGNLSSYASTPPVYTAFGFSPSGSNVGHDDIKKGFGAFGVSDAWGKLTAIASLIGSGSLSLKNDFTALAQSRHLSAHSAANIPTADLQTNINSAIVIGMSVDILGNKLGETLKKCRSSGNLHSDVAAMTFPLRYLDNALDGSWHERPNATARTVKKYADRDTGKAMMKARSSSNPIVIRSTASTPMELAL